MNTHDFERLDSLEKHARDMDDFQLDGMVKVVREYARVLPDAAASLLEPFAFGLAPFLGRGQGSYQSRYRDRRRGRWREISRGSGCTDGSVMGEGLGIKEGLKLITCLQIRDEHDEFIA